MWNGDNHNLMNSNFVSGNNCQINSLSFIHNLRRCKKLKINTVAFIFKSKKNIHTMSDENVCFYLANKPTLQVDYAIKCSVYYNFIFGIFLFVII